MEIICPFGGEISRSDCNSRVPGVEEDIHSWKLAGSIRVTMEIASITDDCVESKSARASASKPLRQLLCLRFFSAAFRSVRICPDGFSMPSALIFASGTAGGRWLDFESRVGGVRAAAKP